MFIFKQKLVLLASISASKGMSPAHPSRRESLGRRAMQHGEKPSVQRKLTIGSPVRPPTIGSPVVILPNFARLRRSDTLLPFYEDVANFYHFTQSAPTWALLPFYAKSRPLLPYPHPMHDAQEIWLRVMHPGGGMTRWSHHDVNRLQSTCCS